MCVRLFFFSALVGNKAPGRFCIPRPRQAQKVEGQGSEVLVVVVCVGGAGGHFAFQDSLDGCY